MTSVAQEFSDNPSEGAFHRLTKDQLIAAIFENELSSGEKRLKHILKSVTLPYLVEKGVLPPVDIRDNSHKGAVYQRELDNQREE